MTLLAESAPTRTAPVSTFAGLRRAVQEAGLLRRRRWRYAVSVAGNAALLGATFAAVAALGSTWWVLALAVPAALFTVRTCFLGHDAAHQQIARTKRVNRWLGLLHGNLGVGMSYGWWADKHNRHHANPNHLDKDPDVGAGALVWTADQAGARRGAARWLARHQAAFYLPLLLLEAVHLKVSSLRFLIGARRPGWRGELLLLGLHLAGYATLLCIALNPLQALAFVALHQALTGLHLGLAFAPNHKGMPTPPPGARWDHLHRQVLTSRNVRGGPVTDWLLGGLNYQIEHHLFPNLPRPSLRRAQPLVRAHCRAVGLPYTECGAVDSYRTALGHLHRVGA